MKYLITGTGRCGTGYVALVLNSTGVTKCTHEQVFNVRGIDFAREQIAMRRNNPQWGWDGESSWYATAYLDDSILDGVTIIHLVRHPKEVIDSQLSMGNWTHPAYNGAKALLPYLPGLALCRTPLEMSAYWYVEWNRLIEPHADIFHRVEDDVRILLDKLDVEHIGKVLFDDKKYNTRRIYPSDVNLREDLSEPLCSEIIEMAHRYGYSV
jgi:hypothetical protein